jgi:hypothetical protein
VSRDSGAIAIRICPQDIQNALSDAENRMQAAGVYNAAKLLDSKALGVADAAVNLDASPTMSAMVNIMAALEEIDKIGEILANVTHGTLSTIVIIAYAHIAQIHPWVKIAYTVITSVYKVTSEIDRPRGSLTGRR